jgi:hypothetical protein
MKDTISLTLIDRFHPRRRKALQAAIDAGNLQKRDELELLTPDVMRPLARLGIRMLVGAGIFFIALNFATYFWQKHTLNLGLTLGGVLLWLVINIVGSVIILPLHELIHGLAFLFWGGKPFFGAKLPFALYCGARQQIFPRNQYLVVGLAPLVIITILALLLTFFSPVLASYTLFANLSNFSGAVGDLWVASRILRHPPRILVEDTDAGYRAWEILL